MLNNKEVLSYWNNLKYKDKLNIIKNSYEKKEVLSKKWTEFDEELNTFIKHMTNARNDIEKLYRYSKLIDDEKQLIDRVGTNKLKTMQNIVKDFIPEWERFNKKLILAWKKYKMLKKDKNIN